MRSLSITVRRTPYERHRNELPLRDRGTAGDQRGRACFHDTRETALTRKGLRGLELREELLLESLLKRPPVLSSRVPQINQRSANRSTYSTWQGSLMSCRRGHSASSWRRSGTVTEQMDRDQFQTAMRNPGNEYVSDPVSVPLWSREANERRPTGAEEPPLPILFPRQQRSDGRGFSRSPLAHCEASTSRVGVNALRLRRRRCTN